MPPFTYLLILPLKIILDIQKNDVYNISINFKGGFIIINQLIKEQQKLSEKLQQIQKKLSHFPEGKLICTRNSTRIKWYLSNGSNPIYLPKKDFSKAQQLALKKYYLLQEKEISYQLKILNQFLNKYQNYPQKSNELLSPDSLYYPLLAPTFKDNNDYFSWASAPYHSNTQHPESLIHKCMAGHYVRSKSEVIIANALFQNHIPYRYECELILSGIHIYPDFTICHPRSGDLYYWEHFGMIDNASYQPNVFSKLRLYMDNNIYPSINLITTYETATHPIDSIQVEKKVEEFL